MADIFYSGAALMAKTPRSYEEELKARLISLCEEISDEWNRAGLSECAVGFGVDREGEVTSSHRVRVGKKTSSAWIYRHVNTFDGARGDSSALRQIAREDAAKISEKLWGRVHRSKDESS